jgi:hypothetical protein
MKSKDNKYEKDERARTLVGADDVSVYPQKGMPGLITYGNPPMSEKKNLPVKVRLVKTDCRPFQFILEFGGEYHVESLSYMVTDPREWWSYAKVWLSIEDSLALSRFITESVTLLPKTNKSRYAGDRGV